MSYRAIRPLLFRCDAETAHDWTHRALRGAQAVPGLLPLLFRGARRPAESLAQTCLDLHFPAPVGLAAGFDKEGGSIGAMATMGFGFVEVGTVTPRPQVGNPRPRLFRHVSQATLQNAMGFNNSGMETMAARLSAYRDRPSRIPVGVNVGKNKDTALEDAHEDYRLLFRRLSASCDFFVVNVSSPNTPGLRSLQDEETVRELVRIGVEESDKPVLVKLAPDLAIDRIVGLCATAAAAGARGVVLTNTTIDYSLVPEAEAFGGLSGRVLKEVSFEILREVAKALPRETVLISVGGVDSAEEVWRRLRAGARLVELYSALVFEGPGLIARIHRDLAQRLAADGVGQLEEIIGVDI